MTEGDGVLSLEAEKMYQFAAHCEASATEVCGEVLGLLGAALANGLLVTTVDQTELVDIEAAAVRDETVAVLPEIFGNTAPWSDSIAFDWSRAVVCRTAECLDVRTHLAGVVDLMNEVGKSYEGTDWDNAAELSRVDEDGD